MTELSIRIHAAISSFIAQLRQERGQDMIEYALFGGGLAVLIIGAVTLLNVAGSNPIESIFNGIEGCIDFEAGGCNPF